MICWAMGETMYVSGDHDRPPNQVSVPQSYFFGGVEAAGAALFALYGRNAMGEGQHVDVSIRECLPIVMQAALQYWDMYRINIPRGVAKGVVPKADGTILYNPNLHQCKDGLVFLMLGGGKNRAYVLSSAGLVKWMAEEGMAGDLVDLDWSLYDSVSMPQEIADRALRFVRPFLMKHTKAELLEQSIKRNILLAPINTPADIAEDEQLAARGFFVKVKHPELNDTLTYCGPWMAISETPLTKWRRAPLIGEHNVEVYENELGFSREQILSMKQANVI